MIYSRTCGYAIQAVTRLAMLKPSGFLLLEDLCDGTDLPRAFVAKIMRILVGEGLLLSAKGRRGGFALARAAETVHLSDIVKAIDGDMVMTNCVVSDVPCACAHHCPLHAPWCQIREQIAAYLTDTTLADTTRNMTHGGMAVPGRADLPGLTSMVHPPRKGRRKARAAA